MDYEERELLQPIWAQYMTLFGGFNCHLNDSEANEWHEYLMAHELHKKLVEKELAFNVERIGMDVDNYRKFYAAHLAEMEQIVRNFFNIGKEWFAGLVERRRAARDEKKAARHA